MHSGYNNAYERAMSQGVKTAEAMLIDAVTAIDRVMKTAGYAKANPALTGAFLQAAMHDAVTFSTFAHAEKNASDADDGRALLIEKLGAIEAAIYHTQGNRA